MTQSRPCVPRRIVVLAGLLFASVLLLPAYFVFFVQPAITGYLIESTEREAVRVARYLAAEFVPNGQPLVAHELPVDFARHVRCVLDQFLLKDVKLFSADGTVLFSTDPSEIGQINTNEYFRNVVAAGNNYTKFIRKDRPTLEGKIMHAHVIETYVPILQQGRFVGAFEIYYDLTARKERLDRLLRGIVATVAVIVVFMLAVVVMTVFTLRQTMVECNRLAREAQVLRRTVTDLETRQQEAESSGGEVHR